MPHGCNHWIFTACMLEIPTATVADANPVIPAA